MLHILRIVVRPVIHTCIRDTSSHQKQRASNKGACAQIVRIQIYMVLVLYYSSVVAQTPSPTPDGQVFFGEFCNINR